MLEPVLTVSMRPTLIRGGLLIDGTGGAPLPESAVLIHEGRIVAVGAADALGQPDDAEVIDARGMVVLPGLDRRARPPDARVGAHRADVSRRRV